MSRKLLAMVLVAAFVLGTVGVSLARGDAKCEVKSVNDETVTLDCGKDADKLKTGDMVEIKKARRAIEGC